MRGGVGLEVLKGLSHRIAYAIALAFLSWALATAQASRELSVVRLLAYALDFPVALVGHLIPLSFFSGIDLFFKNPNDSGFGEFARWDEAMWLHVRAATASYVLLFYVPNLVKSGRGLIRRRSASSAGHSTVEKVGSGLERDRGRDRGQA